MRWHDKSATISILSSPQRCNHLSHFAKSHTSRHNVPRIRNLLIFAHNFCSCFVFTSSLFPLYYYYVRQLHRVRYSQLFCSETLQPHSAQNEHMRNFCIYQNLYTHTKLCDATQTRFSDSLLSSENKFAVIFHLLLFAVAFNEVWRSL